MSAAPSPTVAMTVGCSPAARYSVHRGYVETLWDLGATVVIVPAGAGADVERTGELMRSCAALLVTGGPDVDPSSYGARPSGLEKDCDPGRDRIEVAAVHAALQAGQRVLGICRGMQLLCVAMGGTLLADLPAAGFTGHDDEERQDRRVHDVEAAPGSLASTVLAGETAVNSIHHQAVADAGAVLRVSARCGDGVIEAVESDDVLGVQWHPERLPRADAGRTAPFRWLIGS